MTKTNVESIVKGTPNSTFMAQLNKQAESARLRMAKAALANPECEEEYREVQELRAQIKSAQDQLESTLQKWKAKIHPARDWHPTAYEALKDG